MTVHLTGVLADYFAAEAAGDAGALASCFTAGGIVHDEGEAITGPAAIGRWMQAAKLKYQHTAQPIETSRQGDKVIVRARVSGNFPGSPLDLDHIFGLDGDRIASLEIRP